jgi:hypothetical protein
MALSNEITIPQTTLPVGTRTFSSNTLPAGQKQWIFTLNLVSWPVSGDVLQLQIDESPDDGVTWLSSAGVDFSAPQKDKLGNTLTTITWAATSLLTGTTCRARLTVTVLQSCTISGTLQTQ